MGERFDHRTVISDKRYKRFAITLVVLNVLANLFIVLPILLELLGEPPEGDEVLLSAGLLVLVLTTIISLFEFVYHKHWVTQLIRGYLFLYVLLLGMFGVLLTIQSWILLVVLLLLTYISVRKLVLNKDLRLLWLINMSVNLVLSVLMVNLL